MSGELSKLLLDSLALSFLALQPHDDRQMAISICCIRRLNLSKANTL